MHRYTRSIGIEGFQTSSCRSTCLRTDRSAVLCPRGALLMDGPFLTMSLEERWALRGCRE